MPKKPNEQTIVANGHEISVRVVSSSEKYISLTDVAKTKSDDAYAVLQNWIRNRNTIEYLGLWESLNNPGFNPVALEELMAQAGSNTFSLSPKKWIEMTNAVGLESKSGRYGGTYAHWDIAMEFMSWMSPAFKLYFIQDYQQMKIEEQAKKEIDWNPKKMLLPQAGEVNTVYGRPARLIEWDVSFESLSEEDILNMAIFGITLAEWQKENTTYSSVHEGSHINQIITHLLLKDTNATLIRADMPKKERFKILNEKAIESLRTMSELQASTPNALPEVNTSVPIILDDDR